PCSNPSAGKLWKTLAAAVRFHTTAQLPGRLQQCRPTSPKKPQRFPEKPEARGSYPARGENPAASAISDAQPPPKNAAPPMPILAPRIATPESRQPRARPLMQ